MTRRMLVHRAYHGYTGGHGKMLDYMHHVQAHPRWQALLYQSPAGVGRADNPFDAWPHRAAEWRPQDANALLLGGMDWGLLQDLPDEQLPPVVNLVQGIRHADPSLPLRTFLARPALRICVSRPVRDAIVSTGRVNGPVHVIPLGIDVAALQGIGDCTPSLDVFIDAIKQPAAGRALSASLVEHGLRVLLHQQRTDRAEYLQRMAQARIVVALPEPEEGFYLPGLEAMAMRRALVQPDCIGSREYVVAGANAIVPAHDVQSLAEATRALAGDDRQVSALADAALRTAARFTLDAERAALHAILDSLDSP